MRGRARSVSRKCSGCFFVLSFALSSYSFGWTLHVCSPSAASSASEIKKSINDLMLKCGLHSAACTQRGKEAKSQIMFTGSIEKMKKAIWQVRETLSWVRSIQGMDDVGTAYTVQQVGKGFKARIQFEACVILFNAE